MLDLIDEFEAITGLPDDIKLYLLRHIKQEQYLKKEYLLKAGETCRYLYFVRVGLVYGFITKFRQDISMRFASAGEMCFVPDSFFQQVPSRESLQAIYDSKVYSLSFDTVQHVCKFLPKFYMVLHHYYSQSHIEATDCLYMFRSLDGMHKYKWLKEQHGNWFDRLSTKMLARYIGMSSRNFWRFARREPGKPSLLPKPFSDQ